MGAYCYSRVISIDYDPYRSARLALCTVTAKEYIPLDHPMQKWDYDLLMQTNKRGMVNLRLYYIIAPDGLKPDMILKGRYVHDKQQFVIGETL